MMVLTHIKMKRDLKIMIHLIKEISTNTKRNYHMIIIEKNLIIVKNNWKNSILK
jgi:hypothetical protein